MCASNTYKIYLALLKCFYIVIRSLIYLLLYIMHSLTPPITFFILPTRFKVFPPDTSQSSLIISVIFQYFTTISLIFLSHRFLHYIFLFVTASQGTYSPIIWYIVIFIFTSGKRTVQRGVAQPTGIPMNTSNSVLVIFLAVIEEYNLQEYQWILAKASYLSS